jgi:hypothetical protein
MTDRGSVGDRAITRPKYGQITWGKALWTGACVIHSTDERGGGVECGAEGCGNSRESAMVKSPQLMGAELSEKSRLGSPAASHGFIHGSALGCVVSRPSDYTSAYLQRAPLQHSINVTLHTYVTYENSHQEFSELIYSSYQPLHPGGATHYEFSATSVSA